MFLILLGSVVINLGQAESPVVWYDQVAVDGVGKVHSCVKVKSSRKSDLENKRKIQIVDGDISVN